MDLKFFSKLLEKILELQSQKKRKPKVPSEKKARKPTKKANGKINELFTINCIVILEAFIQSNFQVGVRQ